MMQFEDLLNARYKIMMTINSTNNTIDMPGDRNLSINEAYYRVSLYEKRNPSAEFTIDYDDTWFFNHMKKGDNLI